MSRPLVDSEPPSDSTPTPIVYLGWRDVRDLFVALSGELRDRQCVLTAEADRLRKLAHVTAKNTLRLREAEALRNEASQAEACSRQCDALAYEALRIADHVTAWPDMSDAARNGDRDYVNREYLAMRRAADRLTNDG